MLDPTQDTFGSEATAMAGARRGFGTLSGPSTASPLAPPPLISGPPTGSSTGPSVNPGMPLAPPPLPPISTQPVAAQPLGSSTGSGASASIPPPPLPSRGGSVGAVQDLQRRTPTAPASATPAAPAAAFGNGWAQASPAAQALQKALQSGLTGQAAVDYVNANTPYSGVIAYYPGQNIFGLPDSYVSPNASGAFDLVQRQPGDTGASTVAPPSIPTTGAPTSPLDLSSVDSFTDPSTQFLTDFVQQYMGTLLAPPYTDAQTAALKAQPMAAIESNRQAAIQNAKEQLGGLGVDPTSGVVASTIANINRQYDALRAQADNQFATSAISRSDSNKQQALALSSLLADIPVQRLQVAEQAAGMGANPANLFSELSNFTSNANTANLQQEQVQQQFNSGLGQLLGSLSAQLAASRPTLNGAGTSGVAQPWLNF